MTFIGNLQRQQKHVYKKEKFKLKKLFMEIKKKIETILRILQESFPDQSKMFFDLTKIFNHTKQIKKSMDINHGRNQNRGSRDLLFFFFFFFFFFCFEVKRCTILSGIVKKIDWANSCLLFLKPIQSM
jgi:hypothetical protein